MTYKINLPDNEGAIFWASCQFGAVWGESTEPDFITVVIESLYGDRWKLVSVKQQHIKFLFTVLDETLIDTT